MKAVLVFALFALVAVISAQYIAFVQEYPCRSDCYLSPPCEGCRADRSPRDRLCTTDLEYYFPLGKCVPIFDTIYSFKRNDTHFQVYVYGSGHAGLETCEKEFEEDDYKQGLVNPGEDDERIVHDGYDLRVGYCFKKNPSIPFPFSGEYMVKEVHELPTKFKRGTFVTRYFIRPEYDGEPGKENPKCETEVGYQVTRYYYSYGEVNCTDTEIIVSKTDGAHKHRPRVRLQNQESYLLACNFYSTTHPDFYSSVLNRIVECGKESSALSIVASLSVVVLAILSIVHF